MTTRFFGLVLTALLLASCLHHRPASDTPATVASISPPPATAVPTEPADGPAMPVGGGIYRTYHVGPLRDPAHPELLHGPGIVYERIKAPDWDTSGRTSSATVLPGPVTTWSTGAEAPDMSAADQAIFAARSRDLIAALLEQNLALTKLLGAPASSGNAGPPVSAAPQGSPASPASSAATPAPSPSSPPGEEIAPAGSLPEALGDPSLILLSPSPDNVVELSAALLHPRIPGLKNPFAVRYVTTQALQSREIRIDALSLGAKPACVIADHLYQCGEELGPFRIAAIDADGVYLRKDRFLIRIPMQDQPVTLRFP